MRKPQFKKFKNHIPPAGFYIFKDYKGKEEKVYAQQPEYQYGNVYSIFITYPNTRKKTGNCDFGIYRWINRYTGHTSETPTEWREMTEDEITEFKKELYRFDRKKD